MPLEAPQAPGTEPLLQKWFNQMSDDDRSIIEADIFNNAGSVSFDLACSEIQDEEVARQIVGRFNLYLAAKRAKEDRAKLKAEAADLAQFIENQVFPE
jgi:hypothetical protein